MSAPKAPRPTGLLRAIAASGALSVAVLLEGCHADRLGSEEPIRVHSATFVQAPWPGEAPLTDEAIAGGAKPHGSHVTIVESANNVLRPGQIDKRLSGRVDATSVALGVRLADAGSGHWVLPLGPEDPANPGEFTFSIALDVALDAPPGLHDLWLSGIDADGRAGTTFALPVCIASPNPDGLSACDASIPPPAAVLSLAWDADVDLDLMVVVPGGKLVDPKHPSTAPVDEGGASKPGPGDGVFDHDGTPLCAPTGGRREDLVFAEKPKPGTYYVFANLFDACGASSVRFDFALSLAEGDPVALEEVLSASGELLASQANGGAALGLYVTEFTIQ